MPPFKHSHIRLGPQGQLILEKQDAIKRRLKARFAGAPVGISLADALQAERREKAKRETSK